MTTAEPIATVDAALKADLQETCDRVANSVPFSREEQDAALKRIDRMRDEIRKLHGVQIVAVDLIRESRDAR
jgi:hypothetical protein